MPSQEGKADTIRIQESLSMRNQYVTWLESRPVHQGILGTFAMKEPIFEDGQFDDAPKLNTLPSVSSPGIIDIGQHEKRALTTPATVKTPVAFVSTEPVPLKPLNSRSLKQLASAEKPKAGKFINKPAMAPAGQWAVWPPSKLKKLRPETQKPLPRPKPINNNSKCWNCGKYGHKRGQCTEATQKQLCYLCGLEGVTAKTCPRCGPYWKSLGNWCIQKQRGDPPKGRNVGQLPK